MPTVPTASRQCGPCSLCCKVMGIAEIDKPSGKWCPHVVQGQGCAIYADRPRPCADFVCGYLGWDGAPEHWFPRDCNMVIVVKDARRMVVHVDPDHPEAWRAEPCLSDLRRWAVEAAREERQLVVSVARHMFAMLPGREVDMGYVARDEVVFTGRRPDGTHIAVKLKADDPRLAGHDVE